MSPERPPFWSRPWSYPHLLLVSGVALLASVGIQALHPQVVITLPSAPWHWPVAAAPAVIAAVLVGCTSGALARILAGIPLTVAALVVLILAVLPLAIWPTGTDAPAFLASLGLSDSLHALPLALGLLLVLVNLGAAVAKRLPPRSWLDAIAVTLHLGLVVVFVSGIAGAATIARGQVVLERDGSPVAVVRSGDVEYPLPIALILERFRLDRFPPTLVLSQPADSGHQVLVGETLLTAGSSESIAGCTVAVAEFLPRAAIVGGIPRPYLHENAGPAVRVRVSDGQAAVIAEGWLHAPTQWGEALLLDLGHSRLLGLREPRVRRFAADVQVLHPDGSREPVELAVNQPLRISGWWLYLLSYDELAGAASRTVVLEAVEDRTLPGIYLGIALIALAMLGVLAMALRPRITPPWEGVP